MTIEQIIVAFMAVIAFTMSILSFVFYEKGKQIRIYLYVALIALSYLTVYTILRIVFDLF